MSEVRCRADHRRYLADRDHDRVPVLGQFDVIGGHDIDRPDDGPPIDNDNAHRLRCRRDFGEPGPEGEFVAALLVATRLISFNRPNRRVEDYLDLSSPRSMLAKSAPAYTTRPEKVWAPVSARTRSPR